MYLALHIISVFRISISLERYTARHIEFLMQGNYKEEKTRRSVELVACIKAVTVDRRKKRRAPLKMSTKNPTNLSFD